MPQYIRAFVPGGTFFSRSRGWTAAWRWNNVKGGMHFTFPPYRENQKKGV
jgi:hypothetical protein